MLVPMEPVKPNDLVKSDDPGAQPAGVPGASRRYAVEPLTRDSAAAAESNSRLVTLLLVAFLIAILFLAKEFLVPMALGALLSFLLAIPAARLERLGLGRVWAAATVATLAFAVIGGVGYVIVSQMVDLAGKLPLYEENLRAKIESLRPAAGGTLTRIRQTVTDLGAEFQDEEGETTASKSAPASAAPPARPPNLRSGTPPVEPVPVKVVETKRSGLDVLQAWAGPLLAKLGTFGIVVIFVLFMLIQREDLRDRLVRLAGQRRITVTTQALDEAADRVSRYLLMQLTINVTYGIPVAIGLSIIGVPNALLWGLLATLLRFIPYIGPWIAALMPIGLALAVFDSWGPVVAVVALFLVLELVSNNVMEPLLYGHSTGLTPFAVLVSAVFWTWLWGGVGLFMATPLTVCLVVLGRYVPQLHFLEVMFGDEPVLTPAERLYQRLLAMDMEDAAELAEDERKERTLLQVYDDLLLPTLSMAERDRHSGWLAGRRGDFAMSALESMVEELGVEALSEASDEEKSSSPEAPEQDGKPQKPSLKDLRVLVLAARDEADYLAGRMLAVLLNRAGARAATLESSRIGMEVVEKAAAENPDVIVISAMPPLAVSSARLLGRRLRARSPDKRIVIALWQAEGNMQRSRERLESAAPNALVTTLSEALTRIPAHPPATPGHDAPSEEDVRRSAG